MDDQARVIEAIGRQALDYAILEYKDVVETWRDIERKAQGTVAIAGIFIAGVVALQGKLSSTSCAVSASLAVVIALLTLTVVCSIVSMRVSSIEALTGTDEVLKMAKASVERASRADGATTSPEFWEELATLISEPTQAVHAVNRRKADWVAVAQITLGIAVLIVGVLLTIATFTPSLLATSSQ